MSALGIVPPRLWNERGDKINIDNNRISVLVKESGIEVRTVRGSVATFVTKADLQDFINKALKGVDMNYLTLPNEFDGVSVRAVVEVMRGTQVRREVTNITPQEFPVSKVHDIPFFANYGFIPSTLDGDGDCLDCYIIGDNLPVKSIVTVYPRLCIDYVDRDGQDYKIISTLDPYLSDEEVRIVAEAICRAMGLLPTALQDKDFAMRVIAVTQV